ncbi:TonB-dependent receptor [uncultured Desulfobacter sp.]|uniref:TonB-dependent receptor n=1 Tax=uncultured Desulfobacter sp. TaxID=240139 RepID=UPI0029F4A970|nr:TonB-dependent receptor [uncultured Desulfobacter sp.]
MRVVKHVLFTVAVTTTLALYSPTWAADDAVQETQDTASVETASEELETMTVIATKTPKAPLDSPASVSVISEDEIDAFSSEHPFKPLFRAEGIYPRQYRGLADYWSRPMIRGSRALVMVDGLNWYDYGQYYHTGSIPMLDIDKIEVVRGPFSALYGTLAQTGVINYVTKIPYDMEAEASFTYGTDNTQFYKARIADRPFMVDGDPENLSWAEKNLGDKFFYSMSFKYRTTDGYETNPTYKTLSSPVTGALDATIPIAANVATDINPQTGDTRYIVGTQGDNWYEDYGAFLKTGYEFNENSKIWYSFNVSQFEYGWSGGKSYLRDANGNRITSGDVYIQDGADYYQTSLSDTTFTATAYQKESYVHTLHYDYSIPNKVDINALVGYSDKETQSHSVASAYTKIEDNDMLQADLSATFHMMDDKFLLTMGTQGVKETATVTKHNLSNASDADSWESVQTRESGESLTWGTFIQAEYTPIESTTLYIGGRYDHWWATDTEYSDINGNHESSDDVDDGQFSPKASVVYRLMENGILRASYGKSFTAPSLYYRIASYSFDNGGQTTYAAGNPDLDPTTNTSWELGTEWEFFNKKVRVKATYFQNDFDDLIVNATRNYVIDGQSVTIKRRVNAESAKVDGIETAVEFILPWDLKGGLHYTHNWSKYTKTEGNGMDGWEVAEVPTDIFNFWLGYFTDAWDASVNLRYSDSVYDDRRDPYSDSVYCDYTDSFVVDAQVTFRPTQKMALTLSVDNLFDEAYYEYYEAPGRTVMATISIAL